MDHIDATLTWFGRAIDIDRIESELARLRYEALIEQPKALVAVLFQ